MPPKRPKSAPITSSNPLVGYGLGALFVVTLVATVLIWLIPLEAMQQAAYDRAKPDPYARYQAIGAAEFSTWVGRIVLPCLLIGVGRAYRNRSSWSIFLTELEPGLRDVVTTNAKCDTSNLTISRIRTVACSALLLGWGCLSVGHLVHGFNERAGDWPYFRWNSGEAVLPNISDSNRAVIRYLLGATPPEAKILVASDQKLFFLSYYLRPRALFHKMHPESEHVIPLKDQERKLSAYRLDELNADDLRGIPYDYTLEYFEHPDFVNQSEVLDDRSWVAFYRATRQEPSAIPPYLVRLRKVGDTRE